MKDSWKEKLKSSEFTAPLLIIAAILMMQASKYALANIADESNLLIGLGIIQLTAIGLPCIIYYLIKGKKLSDRIYGFPSRGPNILFITFAALFFVCGSMLIKYLYIASGAESETVSFYSGVIGSARFIDHFQIALSAIFIPAVCEELLFRGVIFAEYRHMGTANAVIISAVCFAMFHFSVQSFPVYLFAGLLFGFVTAVTRSVFPSVILHLLSNTLNIYASDYILRITAEKNGLYFVGFVVVILTALAFVLMLSRVESICHSYAEKPPVESIPPKSISYAGRVFFSPTFILLIIVFLLVVWLL